MFTNPNIMMWQACSPFPPQAHPSPQPQLSSKKNTSLWNACNYHLRFKVQRLRAQSGPDIYVWDTTSSHPHPIRIFTGHTGVIISLVFSSPSSLISSSQDYLVKLWEIGILQADPAMADLEPILLTSAKIQTIALQAKDGIAISCNLDWVVRTWDILTGSCKTTFRTIAKYADRTDVQLT